MAEQLAAWLPNDDPDETVETAARAAPGGFASFIAGMRGDPGERRSPIERFAAARDEPDPEPVDADEKMANLLARGYQPGGLSELSRQLADAQAELVAEQEKIERGRKRSEWLTRRHAAGQLSAVEIGPMDLDEGDPDKLARLERRCQRLERRMAVARERISPQREAPADPVESASRRAHEEFRAVTRALLAGQPVPERRPFASGDVVRTGEHVCPECVAAGATPEESFLLHSDPETELSPAAVTVPDDIERASPYCRGCGRLATSCECRTIARGAEGTIVGIR